MVNFRLQKKYKTRRDFGCGKAKKRTEKYEGKAEAVEEYRKNYQHPKSSREWMGKKKLPLARIKHTD